ncbi:MAG: hypothetical protein ACK4N4_16430 [Burkholderiales bacterium]
MTTPQNYIAYAPQGAGLMCAVVYFEHGADVVGWWIGARGYEYHSVYFKLEHFFSTKPTRFYTTEKMDLYGGWKFLYSAREPVLDKPIPVEDEVSHELNRVQQMFVAEWLFFEDDANAADERKAYEQAQLPLRHVNVQSRRFNKFDKSQPVWVYHSHDFDLDVIDYLQQYWPLDYRRS